MQIAMTGTHGLIGGALLAYWREAGHRVLRLVRDKPRDRDEELFWDYRHGMMDWSRFDGFDAVVHLAGKPLVGQRWSERVKRSIRESRIQSTQFMAQALAEMPNPPKVLLCASAVGFYGDQGDEVLTEKSPRGEGFLPDVVADWEAACGAARQAGIRVVHLRFGVVLSPDGGALAMMLPVFKLGLGGPLGSGRQWFSWLSLTDTVGAVDFALHRRELEGPVNICAPEPVTNRTFTSELASRLHRPAFLPAPAFAMRLVFGEMADAALLASARVQPTRLLAAGYSFESPEIGQALSNLLS